MKKLLFALVFLFIFTNAFCQNMPQFWLGTYYHEAEYDFQESPLTFTFSKGGRVRGIKNGNPEIGLHDGSYHVINEMGLNYLVILWDDKTWNKYLIFASGGTYFGNVNLYNEDGYPFFCMGKLLTGEEYGPMVKSPRSDTRILSASSVLTEGNTIYSTDNLDARIGACWAIKGNGIGEKLIFHNDSEADAYFNSLWMASGFVSMEKPHLFRENSRPKKIRISKEGENPHIVELEDTPHLQYISDIWWPTGSTGEEPKDLWIEILEVYPGTKYADTCINFVGWYYMQ